MYFLAILAGNSPALGQEAELAALNAKASALDAEDYPFVQPVCTRCHSPEMFLHSRTWSGWQGIFNQMRGYGAQGTQEQWDHIYKYSQHSLSFIDVNHADAESLMAILRTSTEAAQAIITRRASRPFANLADLEGAVPGLDRALLEGKKRLIFFQ